jgi:hypothetical protein
MHDLESTEDRPDFSNSTSLQRWIESRIMRRVVLTEARRYHLNEEPRVVRRVRQQADQAVLQSIYDTETSRLGAISDADLEAEYYRRSGPNPPPFSQIPPQLREQLRQIATEKLRDDVLRRFTDNLRRKYPVTVNEALLQRIAWPLPGVNTPQPAQG